MKHRVDHARPHAKHYWTAIAGLVALIAMIWAIFTFPILAVHANSAAALKTPTGITTASPTVTKTPKSSPTATKSPTPSPTATKSPTPSPTSTMTPTPTPPPGSGLGSKIWYFAEGKVGVGFTEFLTIANPDTVNDCSVDIQYFLGSGSPITKTA